MRKSGISCLILPALLLVCNASASAEKNGKKANRSLKDVISSISEKETLKQVYEKLHGFPYSLGGDVFPIILARDEERKGPEYLLIFLPGDETAKSELAVLAAFPDGTNDAKARGEILLPKEKRGKKMTIEEIFK